jgi:hypothetical protein
MQKLFAIVLATALSALVPTGAYAEDPGSSVKSGGPVYKPGRQIDSDTSTNATDAPAPSGPDGTNPVKHSNPPYKAGRQIEGDASAEQVSPAVPADGPGKPVQSTRPPYKPGRQADEK